MCGENNVRKTERHLLSGSPPRVRGKLSANTYDAKASRITPACAGKTTAVFFFSIASQDHPRVCGENSRMTDRELSRTGSPPRVRGKLVYSGQLETYVRITPACAGKTIQTSRNLFPRQDHPRVCGENSFVSRMQTKSRGSPPRVRGKHIFTISIFSFERITPACAGKTF